jgi:demethoxyubiquinone hydroxylase (CLK1/Coq7/Cat5 family)
MANPALRRKRYEPSLLIGAVSVALLGLGACAAEQAKSPAPAVTSDQVRGHTDKAFENLKQEERERGANTGKPSY